MAKQQHNIINLVFLCIIVTLFCACWVPAATEELAAPVFLFGDSLLDVGTNNYLIGSKATANNPYYGIDYPNSTPTGRFSNGRNFADYIASLLNYSDESPPPFLALIQDMGNFNRNILGGVNFASGGSGVFDRTGCQAFTNVVSWKQQIRQFETVCGNITQSLGEIKAGKLISNALYIISVGSNDLFDYHRFSPPISGPHFLANLNNALAIKLKILYTLGARKFGLLGVPALGCSPAIRSMNGGACNETLNSMAEAFHDSTLTLLHNLSQANPGMHYALGNSYKLTRVIIDHPALGGFKVASNACCGQGPNKGQGKCMETSNLCKNRDSYVFFDLFHPTQTASNYAAIFLVSGGNQTVSPINFTTLANIHV
ncbi:GDSL esterase/lipase At5g18430-like [Ipomoea triloba]|uniref:GDSL esterase/lipase At5g18430-like n=1 Tax=Ipomoea triloba TaxID=35885 RepID=UPI00125DB0B6|nr:GDSL esterase/lipase At5g18430-like [Ipomoea triloba]